MLNFLLNNLQLLNSMKKYKLLILSLALGANANAALYTLNNGTGSTAAGVETSTGTTFRSGTTAGTAFAGTNAGTSAGAGVIAFGYFTSEDFAGVSTPSSLVNLFVQFGAVNTFGGASTGGNRSVFSTAQNQTITTSPATFAGKNVFFFAGNGLTFSSSTEFLVVKMDTQQFLAADDAANATTPKTITINPGNSTTLIGSEIANVWTTNSDATTTAGWRMSSLNVVPETSTSLLGALGALALLRRRRN